MLFLVNCGFYFNELITFLLLYLFCVSFFGSIFSHFLLWLTDWLTGWLGWLVRVSFFVCCILLLLYIKFLDVCCICCCCCFLLLLFVVVFSILVCKRSIASNWSFSTKNLTNSPSLSRSLPLYIYTHACAAQLTNERAIQDSWERRIFAFLLGSLR